MRYSAEELSLEDPVLFQHKKMCDESLPIGLRCAIACNIAPYYHPKLGIASAPKFIESVIDVPQFITIEEAENFLARLPVLVGNGELAAESALNLSTLIRNWIVSKHAGQELELKRLNSDVSSGDQVIRIEGGLPPLPGTNITMPELHNGHVVDAEVIAGPEPPSPPQDPEPKVPQS
jgi:hypothetical protein